MDLVALNAFSRRFFDFLLESEPAFAALSELDNSHSWDLGALRMVVGSELTLTTHGGELTVFFGPTHAHLDDFAKAVRLIHQIQTEEVIAVEWLEETKPLCWYLLERDAPLVRPSLLLGSPTHVRLISLHGTFNALLVPEP